MATYNFPATSRYYGIDTLTISQGDRQIAYLKRRFLPSPDLFSLMQLHTVTDGERLDIIAASFMNDPTLFWRIADPNAAMNPVALTAQPGTVLKITLPLGVPGLPNNA
jgi:hypothetical protein